VGGATADVTLFAGRADACGLFEARPLAVRACAGFLAGRLQATGVAGVSPAYAPQTTWIAGAARLEARIPLAQWFQFAIGADALVPLTRPSLDVVARSGSTLASNELPAVGVALGGGPVVVFR
jgi:hypothetical protein